MVVESLEPTTMILALRFEVSGENLLDRPAISTQRVAEM